MVISKAMLTMLKPTRAPSSIYQKLRQGKVKSLFRSQLARKERPRHPENLGCYRAWALPCPYLSFLNCGYQTSVFSIIQSFWYNNIRPHPDSITRFYICMYVCLCESCVYACVCVMLWMKSRVLIMLGKYFVTELHSQAADYTFLKTTFLSFFLLWGGSQRTLWRSQFPPSTMCVPGIKLTSTGLAASVFTCRVVSLAPLPILSKDRLEFGLKDIPDSKCVLLL